MPKFAAGIVIALGVLMVASQLALPAIYAGRVEKRLTENGGSAEVSVSAFPALTLLGGSGKRLKARGRDLSIELDDRPENKFDRLDGFDEVDIQLNDVSAAALELSGVLLRRENGGRYSLKVIGSATPRGLGEIAAGPLGGLAGGFLGGSAEVPLSLNATLANDGGKVEVIDAQGEVAGIPAGPIARIVAGAVLDRL